MTALPKGSSDQPVGHELDNEIVNTARFETATETLMSYVGYLTTKIHEEEALSSPNTAKIEALREEKQEVLSERRSIRPDNEKLIAKAIYVYAPIMKALYTNGQGVSA